MAEQIEVSRRDAVATVLARHDDKVTQGPQTSFRRQRSRTVGDKRRRCARARSRDQRPTEFGGPTDPKPAGLALSGEHSSAVIVRWAPSPRTGVSKERPPEPTRDFPTRTVDDTRHPRSALDRH